MDILNILFAITIFLGAYICFLLLFYMLYVHFGSGFLADKFKEIIGNHILVFTYTFPIFSCGYLIYSFFNGGDEEWKL